METKQAALRRLVSAIGEIVQLVESWETTGDIWEEPLGNGKLVPSRAALRQFRVLDSEIATFCRVFNFDLRTKAVPEIFPCVGGTGLSYNCDHAGLDRIDIIPGQTAVYPADWRTVLTGIRVAAELLLDGDGEQRPRLDSRTVEQRLEDFVRDNPHEVIGMSKRLLAEQVGASETAVQNSQVWRYIMQAREHNKADYDHPMMSYGDWLEEGQQADSDR